MGSNAWKFESCTGIVRTETANGVHGAMLGRSPAPPRILPFFPEPLGAWAVLRVVRPSHVLAPSPLCRALIRCLLAMCAYRLLSRSAITQGCFEVQRKNQTRRQTTQRTSCLLAKRLTRKRGRGRKDPKMVHSHLVHTTTDGTPIQTRREQLAGAGHHCGPQELQRQRTQSSRFVPRTRCSSPLARGIMSCPRRARGSLPFLRTRCAGRHGRA